MKYEFFNHHIHINLTSCSKSSLLLFFLPHINLFFLQQDHLLCIKIIEFFFIELSHNSKTTPIKEKVKLFVVLLRSSLCCTYFGNFNFFLWSLTQLILLIQNTVIWSSLLCKLTCKCHLLTELGQLIRWRGD